MANLNDLLEGIIEPTRGNLSAELAQYVLGLKFTDEQIARYEALAYRCQDGDLTSEELSELDAYLAANTVLGVMKAKARHSLIQRSPAA